MIEHRTFVLEPWLLRERELDLSVLAQTESVFALANGHIGLRGNLDEGEPHGLSGTYLGGFFDVRPLPYAEAGYGLPEAGQIIVNVTNGKIMRLLVDDEPFDIRYGELRAHERVLDLRAGVLRREADWVSPAGARVHVRSTRMVSFVQRAVAAILYEVAPVDAPIRAVVQSELVANEVLPAHAGDPRAGDALGAPLHAEYAGTHELAALLAHSTAASGLMLAAAMDHVIDGPTGTDATVDAFADEARLTVAADLEPGERLRIVKLLGYGWSRERSLPALRDQVFAAVAEAKHTGWDGLLSSQRSYLDDFWERADVVIEADVVKPQAAVRFSLFHCLQAAARAERRGIAAKGLTGPGYNGHTFWDSEAFVLPVLTYTIPAAAGDALRWRHATLEAARRRASVLGFAGAAFPWRTIDGQECSGYWPASTAAFHVNADIADAVVRYQHAADGAFEREVGIEILVETARLWMSLGHRDASGGFHIDGVTGPDEYSAIADDNAYTNLMAQRNLAAAADAVERYPDRAAELSADAAEAASWRAAAEKMAVPYDTEIGVHSQAEDFTRQQRWDFDATGPDQYPLLLHFPYFDLYRKQVIKQADLVLALHVCGDAFSDEQKARAFDYYEPLTVRDSSLSACTQATIAAEVGQLQLAYDYFGEAALIDLDDIEHNTRDGLHIASLAGAWIAAVAGFGGMRDHGGMLTFKPRLPAAIKSLAFGLSYRGARLLVEVGHESARYTLRGGEPLELHHHGERVTLSAGATATLEIPRLVARKAPSQPPGRAPKRRGRRPTADA